ncbi:MAG: pantoate--beta-alanine ligase [Cyclobacteriaceae bacterium]|nr:pantoate--beta-alanine ligase [Cyclobacteriaceae bacterium]
MQIFNKIEPLRAYLRHHRDNHFSIGLVPTMGALHNGHLSLIKASRQVNRITVCSIYVNPVQFNNPADLEKYPRTLEADTKMLEEAGCDAVFCPSNQEMYDQPSTLKFDFGSLDKILEGEFRPGHFSGVALVVAKLFNIVQPDKAYFGQKDFQQFKVISRMVEELKFDIELIGAPIIREADGLAMSSRNVRLSKEERSRAVILNQCLRKACKGLRDGDSFSSVKKMVTEECNNNKIRLEYLAIADKHNFTLLEDVKNPDKVVILIAAFVGEVRLIDNMLLADH